MLTRPRKWRRVFRALIESRDRSALWSPTQWVRVGPVLVKLYYIKLYYIYKLYKLIKFDQLVMMGRTVMVIVKIMLVMIIMFIIIVIGRGSFSYIPCLEPVKKLVEPERNRDLISL